MHQFFKENDKMFPVFFSKYIFMYDAISENGSINGVYHYLYGKLFLISIRALICEMHILKFKKKLLGKTSEDRYNYFEVITGTNEFIENFEKKYPVLIFKINKVVEYTSIYIKEIFNNFRNDKQLITSIINDEIIEIVDIHIGEGDTHNFGKSVAIIETNACKIVYKPHSILSDYAFDMLLNWVNEKGTYYKLETFSYICGDEYGWQEYVIYDGNLEEKTAQEYFYKCGMFLGLFYILGTTDIHFENMIVHEGNPYFIDLETLISIPKYINFSNILETNFIPGIQNNIVYDFDYSGLCGRGNVSSKIKTISIAYPKTDEMRIENVESSIPENKNIVIVDGIVADIEEYEDYFLSGFSEIWNLLSLHKEEFLSVVDKIFGDNMFFCRQVIRATQVYSKFLLAAIHPDYLCSVEQQKQLFQRLPVNIADEKALIRIYDEIRQLNRGDVPYFKVQYNKKDLYADCGVVCQNYFELTIREGVNARINGINEINKGKQIDIVRKSLFTSYGEQISEKYMDDVIVDENYPYEVANAICNKVIDDSTGTILFINTLIGNRFQLSSINIDMYEGGGIIWFLTCYGKYKRNKRMFDISLKLFDTAEKYRKSQNNYSNKINFSAFSGVGSGLYLSYNLFSLTRDKKYLKFFNEYKNEILTGVEKIGISPDNNCNYDFMCGISGMLIVLCEIFKQTNDKTILNIIQRLEKRLVAYIEKCGEYETGIAHGFSGIAYALLVLQRSFKERRYKELCIIYLENELVKYIESKEYKLEWCHGISGLLFVRTKAYLLWKDDRLKKQILKLVDLSVQANIPNWNNCLCHGLRGVKEIYSIISKDLSLEIEQTEKLNLQQLEEPEYYGVKNKLFENFMMGATGVAYSHLREEFSSLPSIMILELC